MLSDVRRFFFEMFAMTAGALLWLAHLIVMYGATEVYCSRFAAQGGGGERLLGVGSLALTLAALAVAALLLWRSWRAYGERDEPAGARFVAAVTVALWGFALIAITWTALPLALMPSCSEPARAAAEAGQ
jgi:hypothetical protein